MTVNDSSSSATRLPELDLLASGRLPPIVRALYSDPAAAERLLAPMRLVRPGQLPDHLSSGGLDRRSLADELQVANEAYGHPRASELAAKLADPSVQVVVTGQQPGLYGGPLLALSKMVAAVSWAERLEAEGSPAIAVFWVATEDHDWAELSQASVLSAEDIETLNLGADASPLLPIGMRTFGKRLDEAAREFREALATPPNIQRFEQLTASFYRPESRFGEAFSRFMVAIMGERAPLLLDSMLPGVKRLQQPILRRLLRRRSDVDAALSAASEALESQQLRPQVHHRPGQSPLFVLRGGQRRRVAWNDAMPGHFEIRGDQGGAREIAELEAMIEDNPAAVSAGVLARPVVQDALLGTTLQVLGPAELSYMAQVRSLYSVLEVEAPAVVLRPQVVVIDHRHQQYLGELGISLAELIDASVEQILVNALGLESVVDPVTKEVEDLLDALRRRVVEVDPNLEKPWQKTRDQIGRTLGQLDGKVTSALARRHQMWQRRLDAIRSAVVPNGKLQERIRSVADLTARFGGRELSEALLDQIDLDPLKLQPIVAQPPRFVDPAEVDAGGRS